MKSFSATSFAAETADDYARAERAVQKNPQALFTDFQWFLYRAQNTVYFTAFSTKGMDRPQLLELVRQIVGLAPQLTHGFVGAKPGLPLPNHLVEAVATLEHVDNFDLYPDKWLEPGTDMFERDDLPLFRVKALVRRSGADDEGRAAMLMVRTSHALMEGADSALLSRSLNSGHGTMSSSTNKVPWQNRFAYAALAALMAPLHLLTAHFLSPKPEEIGFRSLVFDRGQLRRVSHKLGVRQRALMFGLVMFAMHAGGKGIGGRKIKTVYTSLNSDRVDADDDFFRVRSINANFKSDEDLVRFIRKANAEIARVEAADTTGMQLVLNAMFKTHRALASLFPAFYGPRFFRFNGGYDMVLTLVPPHRMYGNLTAHMLEPVFCGSYHPGSELCTFVPARKHVTFNFSVRKSALARADDVTRLLAELDAD